MFRLYENLIYIILRIQSHKLLYSLFLFCVFRVINYCFYYVNMAKFNHFNFGSRFNLKDISSLLLVNVGQLNILFQLKRLISLSSTPFETEHELMRIPNKAENELYKLKKRIIYRMIKIER